MMNINSYKLISRVSGHLLFWISFFGILFVFTGFKALNRNFLLIDLPITLVYSYLVAYFLIPYFLRKKWMILLFISFAALSLFLSYIRLLNYDYLYYSIYASELREGNRDLTFPLLLLNAKDFSFGLIIFLATKYTVNWLRSENESLMIEKEQLETEVKFLKTQVDPHFLFNTMNNLYSLSVSGSRDIRKPIMKMWGLMDFMVRESNMKEIRLDKEVQMISDYVELEKLRYGKRLDFRLDIRASLKEYRVPPMILYPLVENCFKHGSAGDPGTPWVYISLEELKDRIRFTARNSLPAMETGTRAKAEESTGLENVRKRLKYQLPGRHKLSIERKSREFEVILDIYY